MKKSDLKDGMRITHRNGIIRYYNKALKEFIGAGPGFYGFHHLNDNLVDKDGDSEYDIMSVSYEWVRQETEEMTLSQVCEALGKDIKIIKEV